MQQARILVAELYGKIDVVADGENVWAEYNNAAEKLLIASSGMSLKLVAGAGDFSLFPEHSLETLTQLGLRRLFSTVARSKKVVQQVEYYLNGGVGGSYFRHPKIKLALGNFNFPTPKSLLGMEHSFD